MSVINSGSRRFQPRRFAMRFVFYATLFISTIYVVSGVSIGAEGKAKGVTLPDDKAIAEARKLVNGIYGKDIKAAKTAEQKAKLVDTILSTVKAAGSPENKYALYTTALDLASAGGDVEKVFEIFKAMEIFDDNLFDLKESVAERLYAKANREGQRLLAEKCLVMVDQAITCDRYKEAVRLVNHAYRCAKKGRSRGILREASDARKDLYRLRIRFKKVEAAIEKIKEDKNDPVANYTIGEYYSFVKGDWKRGLPMLAKSGKEPVSLISMIELNNPVESKVQNELADHWWKLSEENKGRMQENLRSHAASWYQRAIPGLSGLVKVMAEKRVAESKETKEDAADLVNPKQFIICLWEGGKWVGYPLKRVKHEMVKGALKITNNSGVHNHCKLALRTVLKKDFHVKWIIEGEGFKEYGVMYTNGEDRVRYSSLASAKGRLELEVARKGKTLRFALNGKEVSSKGSRGVNSLAPFYSIVAVSSGKSILIRRVQLKSR